VPIDSGCDCRIADLGSTHLAPSHRSDVPSSAILAAMVALSTLRRRRLQKLAR
jgi:hypothetical protein